MRNFEDLPNNVSNDIDIITEIKYIGKIETILGDVKNEGWIIFDVVKREFLNTYLLFNNCYRAPDFLKIDIAFGLSYKGVIYCYPKTIIKTTKLYDRLHVLLPFNEFFVSLFQYLLVTGKVKDKNKKRLNIIFDHNRTEVETILLKTTNTKITNLILKAFDENKFENLEAKINYVRTIFLVKAILKNPIIIIINIFKYFARILGRILQPKGIFVCLLGVDGVGKSTIINCLAKKSKQYLTGDDYVFSFNPSILKKLNKIKILRSSNINPDIRKVHNRWSGKYFSYIRLIYYSIDFIFGYFIKILPVIIRNGIVFADRYFYDYMFNSERYNMQASLRILTLFKGIIPAPDATFFIVGDPQSIIYRKQELSLQDVITQQNRIRLIYRKFKNSYLIENNNLGDTVDEIQKIILQKKK
jgi:thymidylate kinase